MKKWNSSPHPISDVRDWKNRQRLEIRPAFQRGAVWSDAARIMLMDTILRNMPMPKVFLAAELKDGDTHRVVIDGQQRIRAILDFLEDKFALQPPYQGEFEGRCFSELPDAVQNDFLRYPIDFNEALELTDEELREVYSRVNKYTFALTKQELRRADFPGDFLDLSDQCSVRPYFQDIKLFTVANRRRQSDVEYTSELIAGLLGGPQDKKSSLDEFYRNYAKWNRRDREAIEKRFDRVLAELALLFSSDYKSQADTRFRQKADFYSLFVAIDMHAVAGGSLQNKDLAPLREDFDILDYYIEPTSDVPLLREYAIRCVSDANSITSRKWRVQFLSMILSGTYRAAPPSGTAEMMIRLARELGTAGSDMCPLPPVDCPYCDIDDDLSTDEDLLLVWPVDADVFQISNSEWAHARCHESRGGQRYIASELSQNQLVLPIGIKDDENED